jgi:HPt (histidine-containing phosphotransfer) domain-containing protein
MSSVMALPELQASPNSHSVSAARASGTAAPRPAFDPTAILAKVWKQNLPVIRERVAQLERSAADAAVGALTPGKRQEAADIAHKLAGSLGMFGYPEGTRIARLMEELFEAGGAPDAPQLAQLSLALRQALPLAA